MVQVKMAWLVAYYISSLIDPDAQNNGWLLSFPFPSRAVVSREGQPSPQGTSHTIQRHQHLLAKIVFVSVVERVLLASSG